MPNDDLLNRLKSAEISALEEGFEDSAVARLLASVFSDDRPKAPLALKATRDQIIESLNLLVKEAQVGTFKKTIMEQAWRCTHVFKHQNNRVCNVVNGTYRKNNVIRKTCQKCCQNRRNPKTVREELLDALVDDMVASGMSEEEARAQIFGSEVKTEKEITT